jgi:hypothetical protein
MNSHASLTANHQTPSWQANLASWWQRQAYRNKAAEWSLYFMFVSGFMLWNQFSIPWGLERLLLITHIISSLILFPAAVLPFWLSHRQLLKNSNKKLLVVTGQCLDLLLMVCMMSGVFLFLVGNRGDNLGYATYLSHLVSAILITPILMRHAAGWSVLKPLWAIFKNQADH